MRFTYILLRAWPIIWTRTRTTQGRQRQEAERAQHTQVISAQEDKITTLLRAAAEAQAATAHAQSELERGQQAHLTERQSLIADHQQVRPTILRSVSI